MPAQPGSTTTPAMTAQPGQDDLADLEGLAAELAARGLKADLHIPRGGLPYVLVSNPRASLLTETVYAKAGSYWYSWGERITDCDQPAQAAGVLVRVLAATLSITGE